MFTRRTVGKLAQQEGAQNSLEYMLVIGGVAVLIVAALVLAFPNVVRAVAGLACESIDTASYTVVFNPSMAYGSCLVP